MKKPALSIMLMLLICVNAAADIGEGELSSYKSSFMKKVLSNNPGKDDEIRKTLSCLIKDGNSGVRLIDKFGLFLYDSRNSGLILEKIKYLRDGRTNVFIITLKDSSDSRLYSLYLEYSFDGGSSLKLADISFSMIYSERIKSVLGCFGGG